MLDKANHAPTFSTFWDYREYLSAQMRSRADRVSAESSGVYSPAHSVTPLDERLIQAIWANQLIRGDGLKLADGRPVRVLDPGRWNGSAGPDFRGARLMLGSEELTGDVEIHLDATGWRAHGHERDLDFNATILHVVYRNDDGGQEDRLHNGAALPRLELEPYLFPDLETIRASITPDDYPFGGGKGEGLGDCHPLMASFDEAFIIDLLDRAGDERLAAKVRRLEDQARTSDLEQVFYQGLMMSLGTGPGKSLYYLLAKRAPIAEITDYAAEAGQDGIRIAVESILLNVAGLVPPAEAAEPPDEATQRYLDQVRQAWARFEPYWSDRVMAPTRRWFRGIRPVNFPTRRLSAVAGLIERSMREGRPMSAGPSARVSAAASSLVEARPARRLHPALRDLVEWMQPMAEGRHWTNHYSFAAKPAARPMALVGDATARSLVFNAVLPALALIARSKSDEALEEAVGRLYAIFPPLSPNHITDFTAKRLFGDRETRKSLITTERRHQGLFQIFFACCSGQERHCEDCYYRGEA